ncbi:MAG: GIY-YIG nuclease family protein [Bacteroidetes bacterium]|nr:GIY-YIG nuclease family protein [Bacteroidota bacterium]
MTEFFPARPAAHPTIYAYSDTRFPGMLKVGFTAASVQQRVAAQYPILTPGQSYTIELEESAMRPDGTHFTDHEVHRQLIRLGYKRESGEWFRCTVRDVQAALQSILSGADAGEEQRDQSFGLRPEQAEAIEKTSAYFNSFRQENPGKTPHFLWNAKMRFGKTFTAYHLALKMSWKRVLVLTFKPAVQNAWEEDLKRHVDFSGWQFISRNGLSYEDADKQKPFVCFGSFQDYLGKNSSTGGIKTKNEWVHSTHWDAVILDEYHYGAWRDHVKDLFEAEGKGEMGEGMDYFDEGELPITTNYYLYLSGTPFRAIASGEFIEEQIYNWTYSDEQRAKESWDENKGPNPYAALPRMVMLTYQLPEGIREIAMQGEFNEFDLNVFFAAEGNGRAARFRHENEVQKWLDLMRGNFKDILVDELKLGAQRPPMPFSHAPLLSVLTHTFWFLPSVAACHAMNQLLHQRQNRFYQDYKVVVAAGSAAGMGAEALNPVLGAMDNPLETKTITLSCGKLTTGVSVKPWTGIFMLRNSSSPETYFQAAFRVQTPWTIRNPDGRNPNIEEIIKAECYVFDFAPDRALRQIADYSCRLNVHEDNPEKKVQEFIHFLPVLAYDGSSMKQVDAAGILDMAMSGTTATLLARRWESALLVNVDNGTLARLLANQEAMDALNKIEGFRNINQDIETIINKSDAVKKARKDANEKELNKTEKKELSELEKKIKTLRKQMQEKLIKFATRIPVFMYLTDYRERSLRDVITQLEPGLFRKVTGLEVRDFELLVSVGVFNSALMNDAVFKFKRYEDASLSYITALNRHGQEGVGLWDTALSRTEYEASFVNEPL